MRSCLLALVILVEIASSNSSKYMPDNAIFEFTGNWDLGFLSGTNNIVFLVSIFSYYQLKCIDKVCVILAENDTVQQSSIVYIIT